MKVFPIYTTLILLIILTNTTLSETIINPSETHRYIGKEVIVEGKIIDTYDSGKTCFLHFVSSFSAVIFASNYNKFHPCPDDYYYNKKVRIHGILKKYRNSPEIIINSDKQIELLESPNEQISDKNISWEDASEYPGKVITVEGEIISTHLSEKKCSLNFHKNWKRYLSIIIFKPHFDKFLKSKTKGIPLDEYFMNKNITVTGLIRKYNNKPEIVVKNPEQIKVLR